MSAFGLLRLVHLGAMAVWLAAGLSAPADVRESLERGPDALGALLGRLRRTARLMNGAAALTLASGATLVWLGRGWATPPRIWWGLALTLAAVAVGRILIRPAIASLVAASRALGELPAKERARLARRFLWAVRVEDTLRVVVLLLMLR